MRTRSSLLVSLVSLLTLPLVIAQQSGSTSNLKPSVASAQDEWQTLQAIEGRVFPASAARAAGRTDAISSFVADANALKAFYERNPTSPNVADAMRLEALSLLRAAQLGDKAQDVRRRKLVSDVRQRKDLPLIKRVEVAATADNLDVEQATLTGDTRMAAYESTARDLVKEFPALPHVYQSLLSVAKNSPDLRAQAIAQDIVGMPAAPASVRAEAKLVLNRFSLVGKSAGHATQAILGNNNAFQRASGKHLIVYSWSSDSASSILVAKSLVENARPGAAFVGVCLDQRDLAPAKKLAMQENLPGEQIYDWLGRRGEVAERLSLTDPGVVYVVGPDAVIRDISAQRDLAKALK